MIERVANKEDRHQYMVKMFTLQTDCQIINKIYYKGVLTPNQSLWNPIHSLIYLFLIQDLLIKISNYCYKTPLND